MNQKPLVSILIPTHRPDLLKHSLASALAQTYDNIEIIISDNSESDDIRQMCLQYPQIRYYRNPRPTKTDFWMNVENPMQHAKGEFIKYLFDDDLLFPNCIETMIGQLNMLDSETAKSISLIFSSRHVFDDHGVTYARWSPNADQQPGVMDGSHVMKYMLTTCSNPIGELSTVMFHNFYHEQWQDKDLFRYGDTTAEYGLIDVALYMRLLEKGNALYLPFDLSAFRLHQNGASNPAANPLFVNAITDWFFLIQEAKKRSLLDAETSIQALQQYMAIVNVHMDRYPERLTEVNQQAVSLIQSIENNK
ncbi:Putative glycosyltransferase EpsE [Ephemeroptericola cinctiostellae]|uniref:Glycosyltransferase EpsE n=1 Tax=Ephemeroptericola cinctiostellae TaxID=2268024 RepID=A0A345DC30_9BURK|nr:glycosyltransferase family A protein [Ephemeroptericola cinctiostellae]AXF85918.1 Putative glycosyltransferase EpsE [Ephemeroptericola cinctiostellae]